jgi:hypothetical protein
VDGVEQQLLNPSHPTLPCASIGYSISALRRAPAELGPSPRCKFRANLGRISGRRRHWALYLAHIGPRCTPAPLLLLLVVLTHVLAPPGLCVQWLVARCRLIALVLAPPAPLLLLLVVLTRVLAQLGLCVHCAVAQCRMITPNSSLQEWHAFALDKEPWFDSSLVYNRNEDSFNHAMLHNNPSSKNKRSNV